MAIGRVVRPELLDDLSPDDPEALRSRRDLRMINAMMGNFGWVSRQLNGFRPLLASGVVEIGAGEGRLCHHLHKALPALSLTGLDLVPRPADLPSKVSWEGGDFFSSLPQTKASALVGVMIVHHFSEEGLARLAPLLERFQLICLCEPWRSSWSLTLGKALLPFVGDVTKHDMPVSIEAGFCPGELPNLLRLHGWKTRESVDWRGSLRLVAWKP